MSDLYRLVYASKNLLQGPDVEIAEAVSQILATSQRNNAKVGVTGALMFNASAFAQVLEGPQQGVESTFERIQCDPRHGDVTVLQCGPAERRSFANWSMAFVGQSEPGRARWEGIGAASGFDLSRLDGDAVFAMLHGLVLDEEGLAPAASALPEPIRIADKPAPMLDVARVRAELPQPDQALQASGNVGRAPISDDFADPSPQIGKTLSQDKTHASLAVFRASLADERRLTTALRNELDEVRVTLVLQQEQVDALRQERDLWAKRAGLLARALGQEADDVAGNSDQEGHADTTSKLSASIRVVA